jgi:hypothetical protein
VFLLLWQMNLKQTVKQKEKIFELMTAKLFSKVKVETTAA